MDEVNQKTGWKHKAKREFIRYWLNVFYLAIVFGLFAPVGDFRGALLWSSALALGACVFSIWLPVREAD